MPTLATCWKCVMIAVLLLVSGCTPADEGSSSFDCSMLSKTFFSQPTTEQMEAFGKLDVESQYAVFICGNQTREPPALYLAKPFANEGAPVVGFLKSKLSAARGDWTINDIILVFAQMSRNKSYDVAADAELMKVIEDAVARVKEPFWRKRSEQALSQIRKQSSHSQ